MESHSTGLPNRWSVRLALRYKADLTQLAGAGQDVQLEQGLSIGAVWTVQQVARELGIAKALGSDRQGRLALWQVIARVIDQGSRLSAVRLAEVSKLDGCYVLKTDLTPRQAPKRTVHDRYKDWALVEWAFRTSKTVQLEVRPIHVRLASRTRGHALVVMLAYRIVAELSQLCWHRGRRQTLDVTVQEGLYQLGTLCATNVTIQDQFRCQKIPKLRPDLQPLLDVAGIRLPEDLPCQAVKVTIKRKLPSRRKTRCTTSTYTPSPPLFKREHGLEWRWCLIRNGFSHQSHSSDEPSRPSCSVQSLAHNDSTGRKRFVLFCDLSRHLSDPAAMTITDDEARGMLDEAMRSVEQYYRQRGIFQDRFGLGKAPAVVVVDFAYGWTDDAYAGGSLRLDGPVENTGKLLAAARAAKVSVIYTTSPYRPASGDQPFKSAADDSPEFRTWDERACQIDGRLAPRAEDLVIQKENASAFFGTHLAPYLVQQHVDTLLIAGCSTSACIRSTATDAKSYRFRPIVVGDCVGDRSAAAHVWTLFDLQARFADVITLGQAAEYLAGLSGAAG